MDHVSSVSARIGWKALTANEYVPDGYVFLSTPNIKPSAIDFENVNYISEFRFEESPELMLRVGDVLLAKDGNTLGITNVVSDLPRPATVNGSIAVLRTRQVEPRFLRYVLSCDLLQGMIDALRAGMGVPHLFQADIKKLPIPIPPRVMQRTIADFLDAETARIDGIIDRRRQQMVLLEARFAQAVRERTYDEVGCKRLGRFAASVKTGSTPGDLEASISEAEDSLEWISPADVGHLLELLPAKRRISPVSLVLNGLPRFASDAVVIVGIGATAGRVAYVDRLVSGNQQMTVIAPGPKLHTRFLAWQLFGRQDEIRSLAPYTTLPILNNDFLRALPIWAPDLEVQKTIAAGIDSLGHRTRAMVGLLSSQYALLVEHKQALVTAAVTGQLDLARDIAEQAS